MLQVLAAGIEEASIENIALASGLDQALVSAAATELANSRRLLISEHKLTELRLGDEGLRIAEGQAVFPERLIAQALRELGGAADIKELTDNPLLQAAGVVAGKYVKNLAGIGWASFGGGRLSLTAEALADEPALSDEEYAIQTVFEAGGSLIADEGSEERLLQGAEKLKQRKELLTSRERVRRVLSLTTEGDELAALLRDGEVTMLVEANELTPEMLDPASPRYWRNVTFRSYDVTLPAEAVHPGKAHPLVRIIEEVRLAFLELGFSEATCPMAETAFWDFDALFQPQDHPAREMQDTFYCKTPQRYSLPTGELVGRVKAVHEDGGDTGSLGWRYSWSEQRASQVVLRTHMTASSIEAIARNPRAPQKVFSIGRVFRRETVDYKHLPEFYQVDGIIIDERANLVTLMGTLTKFYERLGIPDVMLKPDFFPYTEPSVGVLIRYGGRWMEMGGAGVFRPEVTGPLGCSSPVIAWGLGLERLAMARFGIDSIKELYQSDLDWLKSVPLEA